MAEDEADNERTLVERWLEDQQEWQRTVLAYIDSMVKNDEFLIHLGNAMRGSLLAGKAYPGPAPPGASTPVTPADDRLDQVLFALHKIEGQLQDLRLTLEELQRGSSAAETEPARNETQRQATPKPKSKAQGGSHRMARSATKPSSRKGKG